MFRTRIAAALASSVLVLVAAPATSAAPSHPDPPRTSELHERTPRSGGPVAATTHLGTPTRLPGGATEVFPKHRVVALYGAPQMSATVLGRLSPSEAGRRVRSEARRYDWPGAKLRVRAFELVASIATADRGTDGLYRFRQSDATIARYLRAARAAGARLVLDIQPGRSPFTTEVRALERWLREPDVDVALDPEWNVGRHGVPGRTEGSVDAATINAVSRQLAAIGAERRLPQKVLVIHQFREGSVVGRSDVKQRRRTAVTLSFDGIGSPGAKSAGYRELSAPQLFDGFTLFYRLDSPLTSAKQVVNLRPRPDYVLYQ
jgi:hypothetical protein